MLVLTRKVGECIQIGHVTKVTVVAIQGQRIRLGIDAPKSVRVVRGERLGADERKPERTGPGPPIASFVDSH
jgi:carbon storage regulator